MVNFRVFFVGVCGALFFFAFFFCFYIFVFLFFFVLYYSYNFVFFSGFKVCLLSFFFCHFCFFSESHEIISFLAKSAEVKVSWVDFFFAHLVATFSTHRNRKK